MAWKFTGESFVNTSKIQHELLVSPDELKMIHSILIRHIKDHNSKKHELKASTVLSTVTLIRKIEKIKRSKHG